MTRFSGKMLIFTRCICGFMPNLHKKSWMVSYEGLIGVQAMAFPHGENQIEVACNVDLVPFDENNPKHKVI